MTATRIAVIGGGITGLSAAHRIAELAPATQLTLFEASDRVGGILETVRRGDYLVERSADMFTTREPWAIDLARRVGLASELLDTNRQHRQALVLREGMLHPVPEGFTLMSPTKAWPIMKSPLLSLSGKLRLAAEWFIPPNREMSDESLASFTRRRFGSEVFERLVQPLVGGIYTADPEKLSMAATLPQFLALEREYGSLLKGVMRGAMENSSQEEVHGVRYGQFVAPRHGMQQLLDAIVVRLPHDTIRLRSKVTHLERNSAGKWMITLHDGTRAESEALIYALPGYRQRLLTTVDDRLASAIAEIPHAGCSVVVLGYHLAQFERAPQAFGCVIPAIEKRKIIAASFASRKFAGRAAEGHVLVRVFMGGALQPELTNLPDADLLGIAKAELATLFGVRGEPELHEVVRWQGVMPQYHVGHRGIVERIERIAANIPRFALAGNIYRGVGIPFCVRSGEQAAERVLLELEKS